MNMRRRARLGRDGRSSVRTQRPGNARPGPAAVKLESREMTAREYARHHRCSFAEATEMTGD